MRARALVAGLVVAALAAVAAPAAAAVVTRGPYLQIGTPSRITVRWRTDVATDSRVDYGVVPGWAIANVSDTAQTTEHVVSISGLVAAKRYYYQVGTTTTVLAGGDSSTSFVTAPNTGSTGHVRAWIIGDSGLPGNRQKKVRDAFAQWTGARGADLWLMLGDNAYNTGTDTEFQNAVFNAYPQMLRSTVLWPTRGNHENLFASPNLDYYDFFSMPTAGEAGGVPSGTEAYYSYDWGNVHFICLDSEGSVRTPGGAMAAWLRADLATTTLPWIVAYWHHPPYTKGSHNSDDPVDSGGRMRDMRQYILPILDSTGVDLVFTGHSHSYERSFMLAGHYGLSGTLTQAMKVDSTSGRPDEPTGPYEKPVGLAPMSGTVYTVAGSSSQTSGGTLNHPTSLISFNVLGSVALDVHGNRLDARFIDTLGVVRDSFTIMKPAATVGVRPPRNPSALGLRVDGPNPFANGTSIAYTLPRAGRVRLTIYALDGSRVRKLVDEDREAGSHHASWDGSGPGGRAAPAGIYFAVVDWGGETRATRLVRVR